MNFAMLTDSYAPYVSGVVRSIQRFSKGLIALGHNVYIFAPTYSKKAMQDYEPDATEIFRYRAIPAPTYHDYWLPIPISPQASSLMKELQIDIIHTHSPFLMGALGAKLSRQCDIPLVFTHHTKYPDYSHYFPGPQKPAKHIIRKYLTRYLNDCDHVITPTPLITDYIIENYHTSVPITAIPTGIDLSFYEQADQNWLRAKLNIPEQERIILFVGRLTAEKNPLLVLQAFAKISAQTPGTHMIFVGNGSEKTRLEAWTKERNLSKIVHFTGSIDAQHVADSYTAADLFLFGSTTETQGLVLGEAMAGGTPVVAVKATGTNDIVVDGENGFLADNNADSLANLAIKLLHDPKLHESLSQGAIQTALQLSIESTAGQMLAVYETAISSRTD